MGPLAPPGPHPLALLGQALQLRGDPIRLLLQLNERYQELACITLGRRVLVAGFGPTIHRRVLVERGAAFARYHRPSARRLYPDDLERLDGPPHGAIRRRLAPAYSRARLDGYVAPLRTLIDRELDAWPVGSSVDLTERLVGLVTLLLGRVMLGVDFTGVRADVRRAIREIRCRTSTPAAVVREALPTRMPWSALRHRQRHVRRLEQILADVLRRGPVDAGHPLPPDLARTHATVSLPGAAGVTTAAAVWAFYLLAQHPPVTARLLEELDTRLVGRTVEGSDLASLPYLDQVASECLRLYSNVVVVPRVALEDVDVAGHTLPAGCYVGLFPFALHRRTELFDRPNAFMPERFSSAGPKAPDYAYLPFGAGPHACIGQSLALLVIKLLLVSVLRRYRLDLMPGQSIHQRLLVTQEINLRLRFRVHPQDGNTAASRVPITGDAVGAHSGPSGSPDPTRQRG